jgi:hypothetical protein
MKFTKPNHDRTQTANQNELANRKQSGDQHILPVDQPLEDPHRPHRLNREDMQNPRPTAPDSEQPPSS